MIYRCILSKWAESPDLRRVHEGKFSDERLHRLNAQGYNIYYLPNYPSLYEPGSTVDGSCIDTFEWVFVDMDLKDGHYTDKDDFILALSAFKCVPSKIIDSGNGIHVYWRISDLDAMSFLKIQRRLMRALKTDEAVGQIYQLMRVPGFVNPKNKDAPKNCEALLHNDNVYTCEQLSDALPPITHEDAAYCVQHFEKTYRMGEDVKVNDKLPARFGQLLRDNQEAKDIYTGLVEDRSKGDYRLGHIMFASGFTKEEAASVLVNSPKAITRAPVHRVTYALNIIDKIWTFDIASTDELSSSVTDILRKGGDSLKGTRFRCHRFLDATDHGFRLGQVVGLVAGSGVGKTAIALNMFKWFVERNPECIHMFIPLEQPANEIADRWKTMCGDNTSLHDKVHIMSNYAADGSFRHLSFEEIKTYILAFQEKTKMKVGCVVIDHIGALKKKSKDGENQGLMDICHTMKAFAVQTNTLLVMQSQAPREKAGIGDLELSKDAAYGTVFFESYCDYLVTIWQPLKRCYSEPKCPTVTAFKFCKIRHKKKGLDEINEDVNYKLFFEPQTESFRELTQAEEKSFDFFNNKATSARKKDRKTDLIPYQSMGWTKEEAANGEVDNNSDLNGVTGVVVIPEGV